MFFLELASDHQEKSMGCDEKRWDFDDPTKIPLQVAGVPQGGYRWMVYIFPWKIHPNRSTGWWWLELPPFSELETSSWDTTTHFQSKPSAPFCAILCHSVPQWTSCFFLIRSIWTCCAWKQWQPASFWNVVIANLSWKFKWSTLRFPTMKPFVAEFQKRKLEGLLFSHSSPLFKGSRHAQNCSVALWFLHGRLIKSDVDSNIFNNSSGGGFNCWATWLPQNSSNFDRIFPWNSTSWVPPFWKPHAEDPDSQRQRSATLLPRETTGDVGDKSSPETMGFSHFQIRFPVTFPKPIHWRLCSDVVRNVGMSIWWVFPYNSLLLLLIVFQKFTIVMFVFQKSLLYTIVIIVHACCIRIKICVY